MTLADVVLIVGVVFASVTTAAWIVFKTKLIEPMRRKQTIVLSEDLRRLDMAREESVALTLSKLAPENNRLRSEHGNGSLTCERQ